ncbi:hypothetical protein ABK040_005318 [Willaertia magna]
MFSLEVSGIVMGSFYFVERSLSSLVVRLNNFIDNNVVMTSNIYFSLNNKYFVNKSSLFQHLLSTNYHYQLGKLIIHLKLLGGGSNQSSNNNNNFRKIDYNYEPVVLKQKVDRKLPSDVKSILCFDPEKEETTCHQRNIYSFDLQKKQWNVLQKEQLSLHTNFNKNEKLKIISFNIWFDLFKRIERTNEIINICKTKEADILCFQEVTPNTLQFISSNNYIQENFYLSDCKDENLQQQDLNLGKTVSPYGVMIAIKKTLPITNMFLNILPTRMSRSAVSVELEYESSNKETKKMCFTTVHLESLSSEIFRAKQLYLISTFLKTYSTGFLCGDFNFDSDRNYKEEDFDKPLENNNLSCFLNDFKDLWQELKPEDKGKTFDTEKNLMFLDHEKEVMRYDRMMFKSDDWIALNIELLGTEPFMTTEQVTI